MPRSADAQPECIHYIFIFLRQRRIVRGSYVRNGFRCGRLTTLMSSNDLEWDHVSPGGHIGCRWERELCLECQSFGSVLNQETTKSFPQTVEKEDCNSGL
jgi:hypothetical protein